MTRAIFHGFILAFGLILPLGVQNMFVLTQGALHRRWTGALTAVLTASLCDTLLITAAVSGVSLMVQTVTWFKPLLGWVGLFFLAYLGWVTWRAEPGTTGPAHEEWPPRRQAVFAASVSLLNPHAILDTVGVIGGNSLHYAGQERIAFALACVAVSWLWFFGLATAGHLAGHLASGRTLRIWLNRISALIMWALALQFFLQLVH
ncbi:MAG: LysE/ArgO family amino acid transporter [Mycobacterium leprae]